MTARPCFSMKLTLRTDRWKRSATSVCYGDQTLRLWCHHCAWRRRRASKVGIHAKLKANASNQLSHPSCSPMFAPWTITVTTSDSCKQPTVSSETDEFLFLQWYDVPEMATRICNMLSFSCDPNEWKNLGWWAMCSHQHCLVCECCAVSSYCSPLLFVTVGFRSLYHFIFHENSASCS